jgi:pyruvate dehydrogenase E2 component (dihydrolipoyllysine-residue acetyltransferase)
MDVRLPKLGENAEGGAVVSILVKEGDSISNGQTILELENEKAVAPIPSTASGVVSKLHVKEGDRLTVGQVILSVNESGSAGAQTPAPAAKAKAPAAPAPAAAPAPSPAPVAVQETAGEIEEIPADAPVPAASPEIRRIARELGLDLRRIRATGGGGRVEWGDLRSYIQRLQRAAAQPRPAAPSAGPAPAPVESIDFSKWGEITKKPLSALRKTIARRMTESWHAVPRVTQFDEADITDLMELRKKFAADYEKRGARLTLTSFALQAVVAALKKHPVFNSSLDAAQNEIVFKSYYHIGLAVDTDQGLMVPVIRNVDGKSLFELSKDVQEVAEKARDRKLSADDMKGGTFTISNQGGIGGAHFTPIVNAPEVAILGLGKGALKPVVRDGKVEPRLMMPICVSYDHRVIDGGTAARFTVDLLAAFHGFTEAELKR